MQNYQAKNQSKISQHKTAVVQLNKKTQNIISNEIQRKCEKH